VVNCIVKHLGKSVVDDGFDVVGQCRQIQVNGYLFIDSGFVESFDVELTLEALSSRGGVTRQIPGSPRRAGLEYGALS